MARHLPRPAPSAAPPRGAPPGPRRGRSRRGPAHPQVLVGVLGAVPNGAAGRARAVPRRARRGAVHAARGAVWVQPSADAAAAVDIQRELPHVRGEAAHRIYARIHHGCCLRLHHGYGRPANQGILQRIVSPRRTDHRLPRVRRRGPVEPAGLGNPSRRRPRHPPRPRPVRQAVSVPRQDLRRRAARGRGPEALCAVLRRRPLRVPDHHHLLELDRVPHLRAHDMGDVVELHNRNLQHLRPSFLHHHQRPSPDHAQLRSTAPQPAHPPPRHDAGRAGAAGPLPLGHLRPRLRPGRRLEIPCRAPGAPRAAARQPRPDLALRPPATVRRQRPRGLQRLQPARRRRDRRRRGPLPPCQHLLRRVLHTHRSLWHGPLQHVHRQFADLGRVGNPRPRRRPRADALGAVRRVGASFAAGGAGGVDLGAGTRKGGAGAVCPRGPAPLHAFRVSRGLCGGEELPIDGAGPWRWVRERAQGVRGDGDDPDVVPEGAPGVVADRVDACVMYCTLPEKPERDVCLRLFAKRRLGAIRCKPPHHP